jgi:hypothetical protein
LAGCERYDDFSTVIITRENVTLAKRLLPNEILEVFKIVQPCQGLVAYKRN